MIDTTGDRVRKALEQVERAIQTNYSKQPRFGAKNPDSFFGSVMRWVTNHVEQEPPYVSDSRVRDKWLQSIWHEESHLAGVLSSVTSIDQNRAWAMTGGRNQVRRYLEILRHAEDGEGWRAYIQLQSLSYYTSDLGAVTETGRDGRNGPLRALYHVDPAVCRLTGDRRKPLLVDGMIDAWRPEDFFRLSSMRSTRQDLNGLGYCAVSRVWDMTKIMLAVYNHELEKLGARAPHGLLLLQNISQQQWREAMTAREASLDSDMRKYYSAVAVIAQEGVDNIDAKLVALSELPEGFDIETFTNLLMYAYALCFGYDPIEFWPVLAGQLGRGRETEIQHRKGTGKGGLNFMLAHQDQLQLQLPDTLLFEYEQRDQEGILLEAKVLQAWANVAKTLYEQGAGVLDREQVQTLLVQQGVIPSEWTLPEEDVTATDSSSKEVSKQSLRRMRQEQFLEKHQVRRCAETLPREPIVQFTWPTGRYEVLWESGTEALASQRFTLLKPEPLSLERKESKDVQVDLSHYSHLRSGFEENLGRLQGLWEKELSRADHSQNGYALPESGD